MSEDLLGALLQLEQRLLSPAVRSNGPELDALLAEDFLEFGSSGRVFTREAILAELASESTPPPGSITDARVVFQTCDAVLIAYRLSSLAADAASTPASSLPSSLRSSLWVRSSGRWKLHFHQGTRVAVDRISA